jgi:hypothetical protein
MNPPDDFVIEQLRAIFKEYETVLSALLESYVQLGNSGDCGFWDPEELPEVIAARKLLVRLRT